MRKSSLAIGAIGIGLILLAGGLLVLYFWLSGSSVTQGPLCHVHIGCQRYTWTSIPLWPRISNRVVVVAAPATPAPTAVQNHQLVYQRACSAGGGFCRALGC